MASNYVPPADRVLHSGYGHKLLHQLHSPGAITPDSLMWPLFVVDDDDAKQEIGAMPGQFRWGVNRLKEALTEPVANGLTSIILFGVLGESAAKDATGSLADKEGVSPVLKAIRAIRSAFPSLYVACDLCLCAYTEHGHCGVIKHDEASGPCIDNAASIARLADIAVAYAKAGAHMIAPSDMMDGRIGAIKAALAAQGCGLESRVAVMSYAAKFASCFYGPFRDAARSGMSFGDRSLYQLPPGARGLALRAVDRDLGEGADLVMVKPGMPYLDILRETADRSPVPVAVYQVSGEFAMLYHAGAAGALDLKRSVNESLLAFKRAGAKLIISYFTPQVLAWRREDMAAELAAVTAASAGAGAGK